MANPVLNFIVDGDYTIRAIFVPLPSPTPSPTPSVTPRSSRKVPPTPSTTPVPTTTPAPSPTPEPSQVPPTTPGVSQTPVPSVTPAPSSTPYPTPTPSPVMWRSCLTGNLSVGSPPTGYREVPYRGQGGGMCWEPVTDVGFVPSLDSLMFTYQRNSAAYPAPYNFTAQNPSYSLSYEVKLITNTELFTITPSIFMIPPRESKPFTVAINKPTINTFADGQTRFELSVEVRQI